VKFEEEEFKTLFKAEQKELRKDELFKASGSEKPLSVFQYSKLSAILLESATRYHGNNLYHGISKFHSTS
jgi:hypothetical protein